MEAIEKKYRDTPVDNKKYSKRLSDFIDFLFSKGKVIEAKYHFKKLCNAKPNHARTIRLGYLLSIATFDNEGVRKFDKLLYDSKPKDVEIFWFRLRYYISVNDYKNCEDCCVSLLSKPLEDECLKTVIEACFNLKSYVIACKLIRYLEKEKMTLNDIGNTQLRNIVLERFVNKLVKVKCG